VRLQGRCVRREELHHIVVAAEVTIETHGEMVANNIEDFANFGEFARLYPGDQHRSMTPYAPIVSLDSGREHLKALLPRGVRRAFQMREPVQDIYGRIAARAGQLIG